MGDQEYYECATCCYGTTSYREYLKHGETHGMTKPPDEQPAGAERLETLLALAKRIVITPAMLWDQRVSFAYGNASLDNPAITREMVEKEATKIYGPRPKD